MLVEITEQDQVQLEEDVASIIFEFIPYGGDENEYERPSEEACQQMGRQVINHILRYLLEKEE